jgi:Kef-type K+ transport system membrane component KefB
MDNPYTIAAVWMGLAFLAAMVAGWTGLSVSLVEILVGVAIGNLVHLSSTEWITFLASFGAGLLTFLAGAEIEPSVIRRSLPQTFSIGIIAFLVPFLGVLAFAYLVVGWNLQQAEIAGIALSTTSVAVVYAVMVETGFNETDLGKVILAACFINDLGTVLALGLLFAEVNWYLLAFVVATLLVLPVAPRMTRWVIANTRGRVSEPEVKFVFLMMFFLGGVASAGGSEPILPAYLIGMVLAGTFLRDRTLVQRMRTTAFSILTPFYFIRAGTLVSLSALVGSAGLIALFLALKIVTKFVAVRPLTAAFRFPKREAMYTTLLMSTGLTFGTISALFGLSHGVIDQDQYTVLVTAVILSAFVPTVIAQQLFRPDVTAHLAADRGHHGAAPLPEVVSPPHPAEGRRAGVAVVAGGGPHPEQGRWNGE